MPYSTKTIRRLNCLTKTMANMKFSDAKNICNCHGVILLAHSILPFLISFHKLSYTFIQIALGVVLSNWLDLTWPRILKHVRYTNLSNSPFLPTKISEVLLMCGSSNWVAAVNHGAEVHAVVARGSEPRHLSCRVNDSAALIRACHRVLSSLHALCSESLSSKITLQQRFHVFTLMRVATRRSDLPSPLTRHESVVPWI